MKAKIVSVVAGGAVACVTTAEVLAAFPAVLESYTAFEGTRPLKKFVHAEPDKTTAHNFKCSEIAQLAEALYQMRSTRLQERAETFRLLFKETCPKRSLHPVVTLEVFKFADRLLRVIEKCAAQGRFTNRDKFFLRFVICKPIGGKLNSRS